MLHVIHLHLINYKKQNKRATFHPKMGIEKVHGNSPGYVLDKFVPTKGLHETDLWVVGNFPR